MIPSIEYFQKLGIKTVDYVLNILNRFILNLNGKSKAGSGKCVHIVKHSAFKAIVITYIIKRLLIYNIRPVPNIMLCMLTNA